MSHDATNWAIKQKGLRPATKIVLWHLCDRYHPDNGCFPSQEMLANDCEMSRSAINSHLGTLEANNLIHRIVRKKDGRQERTEYRFPFQIDYPGPRVESAKSCPESRHGAESGKEDEPSPENEENRVRNPDSYLPVREPVTEPVERDARASTDGEAEPGLPHHDLLAKLIAAHPQSAHDSVADTHAAWKKLTPAERHEAVNRFEEWLGTKGARKAIAGLPIYLSEKRWTLLGPKATPANNDLMRSIVQPFTRLWWWLFAEGVRKGTLGEVRHFAKLALLRVGWKINPADRDTFEEASKALRQVPTDGIDAKSWRSHYASLGVEMPLPDRAEWIFVPQDQPALI